MTSAPASPAPADRERTILDLWERGVGLDRWRREDVLLAGEPPSASLGARNLALLALRGALFGRVWPLRSRCPACGGDCAFEVDSLALARGLEMGESDRTARVDWAGVALEARAPTVGDLAAVAAEPDAAHAARALLARCLSGAFDPAELDADALAELGGRIERLDPAAAIGFGLDCPDCGAQWSSMIDVGEALWREIERAAEGVLVEIDALARAYGWTETDVLRLSPTRRAAYLQLVEAS